jgi:glyoxylase-like metal-dependent hydrolase (beta-lactamase superfamily II)
MRVGAIDLVPLSDGTFVARPEYFGAHAVPDSPSHPFDPEGFAWLPIGCFLLRTHDRVILVDAGMGPAREDLPHGMALVGGQLPAGLRAAGVEPGEITDVVLTHLHADHVGWLYDRNGSPGFRHAKLWFGAGDWDHFVSGPGQIAEHIQHGLVSGLTDVHALGGDFALAPGVDLIATPGHTPGHVSVILSSGSQRAILLGDAITCPVQLDEPTWHSFADVDPALAARTRERLWRELEGEDVVGAGAHFPELRFGRVIVAEGRSIWS